MNCVITLVHGTWARHSSWTTQDSPLCCLLRQALPQPILIQPFSWSGGNSLSARQTATDRLVAHMNQSLSHWPGARHYVIAHSHGGNVVLYALRDRQLASRLAGVVCLSTPFLHVAKRGRGTAAEEPLFFAGFIVWLAALLVLVVALAATSPWIGRLPEWLIYAITCASLVLFVFGAWKLVAWTTRLQQGLRFPDDLTTPALFIRSSGDEASGALTSLQFIGWAINRPWQVLSNFIGRLERATNRLREPVIQMALRPFRNVVGIIAGAVFILMGVLFGDSLPLTTQYIIVAPVVPILAVFIMPRYFFGACSMVLGLLLLPVMVFTAIVLLPFAPEFVFASLFLDVTVEATPPGSWKICQLSRRSDNDVFQPHAPGLSHSETYTDPRSLTFIVDWLLSQPPSVGLP